MRKLQGLQYLRALAAISVVAYHSAFRTDLGFAIGAHGVDIFFVISGFIMWVITERKPERPGTFIWDRLTRIAPFYWLATLAMIGGWSLKLFPNLHLSLEHVAKSLAFIPHRSPSNGEIWPLLVQGWTLNYEMFFYLVFALALAFSGWKRLSIIFGTIIGLCLTGLFVRSENALWITYTNPLMLEFLAGILIGIVWTRLPFSLTASRSICAIGLMGFIFYAFVGGAPLKVVVALLAIALVLGTVLIDRYDGMPRVAWAAYLGDASYAIYLWHTFAISVVLKVGTNLGLPALVTCALATVSGVFLGCLFYSFMERPFMRWMKNREKRHATINASRPLPSDAP